jgi:hypothetical protein
MILVTKVLILVPLVELFQLAVEAEAPPMDRLIFFPLPWAAVMIAVWGVLVKVPLALGRPKASITWVRLFQGICAAVTPSQSPR